MAAAAFAYGTSIMAKRRCGPDALCGRPKRGCATATPTPGCPAAALLLTRAARNLIPPRTREPFRIRTRAAKTKTGRSSQPRFRTPRAAAKETPRNGGSATLDSCAPGSNEREPRSWLRCDGAVESCRPSSGAVRCKTPNPVPGASFEEAREVWRFPDASGGAATADASRRPSTLHPRTDRESPRVQSDSSKGWSARSPNGFLRAIALFSAYAS